MHPQPSSALSDKFIALSWTERYGEIGERGRARARGERKRRGGLERVEMGGARNVKKYGERERERDGEMRLGRERGGGGGEGGGMRRGGGGERERGDRNGKREKGGI